LEDAIHDEPLGVPVVADANDVAVKELSVSTDEVHGAAHTVVESVSPSEPQDATGVLPDHPDDFRLSVNPDTPPDRPLHGEEPSHT
jgi:hypothetical protein